MAKMKDIERQLANLPLGQIKLSKIIDLIISVDQYQKEQLFQNSPYGRVLNKPFNDNFYHETLIAVNPNTGEKISLEDVWIDLTYQRILRLKKIIQHLRRKDTNGQPLYFDKMLAGSIDIAIRPGNKIFVWDGFRRSVLALLNGIRFVQASIELHPSDCADDACSSKEAFAFKVRNGDSESMLKEEVYKSGVVFQEANSMKVLKFLRNMRVDVLGTNPGNPSLGGFAEFYQTLIENKYNLRDMNNLVNSSLRIQKAWSKDSSLSGYLTCGMSLFLDVIEATDESGNYKLDFGFYTDTIENCDVTKKLIEYANQKNAKGENITSQNTLIKNRIHGKAIETIAYNIGVLVMGLSGSNKAKLAEELGFDPDEIDMLTNISGNDSDKSVG